MKSIVKLKTMEEIKFSWLDHLFLRLKKWTEERFYRAAYIENLSLKKRMKKCGKGVWLHGFHIISGIENMELGDNVHIASNAFIRANGGVKIGSNTHISRNLLLYSINHNYNGTVLPYDETMSAKPVEIGENVWIGMNVCIAAGSKIGDGAIIGMGAVISGEVPAMSIVGNQKWRELKKRDQTHYFEVFKANRFGAKDGQLFEL